MVSFVKERGKWTGSATELLAEIKEENVVPQVLSKHINQFMLSYLQEENIRCEFKKTSEKRILMFEYVPPEDDSDDKENFNYQMEKVFSVRVFSRAFLLSYRQVRILSSLSSLLSFSKELMLGRIPRQRKGEEHALCYFAFC